jgi:predicted MPP superfamily phosphohydrolase
MTAEPTMTRRGFLRGSFKAAAGLAGTGAAVCGGQYWARKIEPGWIEIERVELALPRLSPAFTGYTIAQASDIHLDFGKENGFMTAQRLDEAVALINTLGADLIALTGDYVTGDLHAIVNNGYEAVLAPALGRLRARDGVVAVPGNHDYWADIATVRRALAQGGVRDLSNQSLTLKRGNEMLHIAGVDDWWIEKSDLPAVLRGLPTTGCAILLAHEPDFADRSAAAGRFDLQLSGHSHGGQVCAPFFGPPVLPRLGIKYPSGLYQVGDMLHYTNRGLGMLAPYVRFNCRPEITLFTLRATPA